MTVAMDKGTGMWTVGWNRPGWSASLPNVTEFDDFASAYKAFVNITEGEGGRQILTEYQRDALNNWIGVARARFVDSDTEKKGGKSVFVGQLIFWIAKL